MGCHASPQSTLRDVVERRPVGLALIMVVIVAIVSGTSRGVAFGEEFIEWVDSSFASLDLEFNLAVLGLSMSTVAVIFIILVLGASFFFWLVSRILGGQPSFAAIFAGVGFISVISLLVGISRTILGNIDENALGIGTSSVITLVSRI